MEREHLPGKVQEMASEDSPQDVRHVECYSCGEDLYWIDVENDEACRICGQPHSRDGCPVNSWGEPTHAEWIGDHGQLYLTTSKQIEVICGGCYENLDYHPDGTIKYVRPDGSGFSVRFMNGVYRDPDYFQDRDAREVTPDELEMVEELIDGSHHVSTDGWRGYESVPASAGDLTKVSSGWHSSMEQSDLSEAINEITRGHMHTDVIDYHTGSMADLVESVLGGPDVDFEVVEEEGPGWDFPVVVVFTSTSNVCSVGLDVYAPDNYHEVVKAKLDKRATPGHAGVR